MANTDWTGHFGSRIACPGSENGSPAGTPIRLGPGKLSSTSFQRAVTN
jgi:hypothetical protein